jgi:thiol-disulfide isomerase/thioredoxin
MKSGRLFISAIALIFFAKTGWAADTDSVAEWQALTNFTMPSPPMEWSTNPPTQAQLGKFDDEEEAIVSAVADRAHAFYLTFPNDINATNARLWEVKALQAAVHYGATNRVDALDTQERLIIDDTNFEEGVRYDLCLDRVGRQLKTVTDSGGNASAAEEAAGRELVKKFPDGPAGYQLLSNLAKDGDLLTMHDLAKVMANSGGPKELTDFGTALLNQINVIGTPLPINFKAADGREISASTFSNKVVLVDFWASWCPPCVEFIPTLVKFYGQYHTNGLEIVGINFDDDTNAAQKCMNEYHVTWPQDFGGYGADNAYGQKYGESLPYVWLVDKKGIVQDIHGTKNTEAKIQKLLAE